MRTCACRVEAGLVAVLLFSFIPRRHGARRVVVSPPVGSPQGELADEVQCAVSPGTKPNDREVIVVRPCPLSTSPFENRKCLTIRQREGLIPPLAAELPGSLEVLVYQRFTAHATLE